MNFWNESKPKLMAWYSVVATFALEMVSRTLEQKDGWLPKQSDKDSTRPNIPPRRRRASPRALCLEPRSCGGA